MAKVADAYLRIAEEHPERFVVIDSDRPPDVVHRDVKRRAAAAGAHAHRDRHAGARHA